VRDVILSGVHIIGEIGVAVYAGAWADLFRQFGYFCVHESSEM
jgi:hypothetical protein